MNSIRLYYFGSRRPNYFVKTVTVQCDRFWKVTNILRKKEFLFFNTNISVTNYLSYKFNNGLVNSR